MDWQATVLCHRLPWRLYHLLYLQFREFCPPPTPLIHLGSSQHGTQCRFRIGGRRYGDGLGQILL